MVSQKQVMVILTLMAWCLWIESLYQPWDHLLMPPANMEPNPSGLPNVSAGPLRFRGRNHYAREQKTVCGQNK